MAKTISTLPPTAQEGVLLHQTTKRAIIFANGEIDDTSQIIRLIMSNDLIVAADGGSNHCLALGLTPHILIGDLDSVNDESLQAFELAGTQIVRYPQRKDFTDLELALIYVQELGFDEIIVLGALGRRWDQTLANLLLPTSRNLIHTHIRLISGSQEIRILHSGESLLLFGKPGDTVSLIPLTDDACGITTTGLEYPLQNDNLLIGSTRGISNVMLFESASISLYEGILLCVMIHGRMD
jgi:thiamine pyrophosphokinase